LDSAGTSPKALGDIPTQMVTVRGNEQITIVVPYLARTARLPTVAMEVEQIRALPRLSLQVEAVCSGDRAANVVTAIYMSAGEDFVFHNPQTIKREVDPLARKRVDPALEIQPQMMVNESALLNTVLPGMRPPTPIRWELAVEDLISRWCVRQTTSGTVPATVVFDPTRVYNRLSAIVPNNWDHLCHLFAFNSGGIRHKVQSSDPDQIDLVAVLESHAFSTGFHAFEDPSNGMAATGVKIWPFLDFEMPFIANVDVDPLYDFQGHAIREEFLTHLEGELQFDWIKAGGNFQLFQVLPCPRRNLWAWNV